MMKKLVCLFLFFFLTGNVSAGEMDESSTLYTDVQENISEEKNLESVTIISDFNVMNIGDIKRLSVKFTPEDSVLTDVSYTSSNPEVISVDSNGTLTALATGESTITAKVLDKESSLTIEVIFIEEESTNEVINLRSEVASESVPIEEPSVNYITHIQDYGWQEAKSDGEVAGTSGESKRLEAIKIDLDSSYSGDVQYRTHVQDIGWQDYVSDGELSGTSGQSKRLEAIQINLIGEISNDYDIYYRVHCQDLGWLGWAKNGQAAGSEGYSYRLEAIQIKLVKKGEEIISSVPAFYKKNIEYTSHIQDIGWQAVKNNGETSGTSGQSKRLEAIKIKLLNQDYEGSIEYRTHIQDIGWQDYVSDGSLSGTSGQSKRLEALQIRLTGDMADNYDVYYRVHAENFGWLGWAKNDEYAGTIGYGYRLEAVQIKLVKKGEEISSDVPTYYKKYIKYESHVGGIGWQETKFDGQLSGTTGQSRGIEAIRLVIEDRTYSGSIRYKSHVQDYGWQDYRYDSQISGTTGQAKNIEAISLELTGEIANYYDVYYRVHSQNFGWLGWAKNGEYAGTTGYGYRIEAYEVKLVKKGEEFDTLGEAFKFTVSGYYEIASKLNEDKVLDASLANTKNGTNVFIYSKNDSIAQIWCINNLNNGYYSISSSMNPNVYLTVNNSNLELFDYLNNDSQLFSFVTDNNDYIYIVSKLNGKYVSLDGLNIYDTINVITNDFNGNDNQKFKLLGYSKVKVYNGVDISSHNGEIDFAALSANTNFVIIRAGFGSDYTDQDDARYIEYIRGCEEYNIPYGIYIYSYALNTEEATSEAIHALRLLRETGNNFKLGVWFDMEDADGYKARRGVTTADGQLLSDICDTFGTILQSNGYKTGIYASLNWLNGPLNDSRLDKYYKWVAHWNGPVTYESAINYQTSYSKPYKLWQFCSDGHIAGIGGGVSNVDLDLGYDIFD